MKEKESNFNYWQEKIDDMIFKILSQKGENMSGLEIKYFVLKPKGNDPYAEASRKAMIVYADWIMQENRDLALDLIKWCQDEWKNAEEDS